MKTTLRIAGVLGAAALVASNFANIVSAETIIDEYPETPKFNPQLPIVKTTHASDHIKANILNAHPVCNAFEDYRTVLYKATDQFLPVGTVSATNETAGEIPLTQTTSRSQSIQLSVNGSVNQSVSANLGGNNGNSKDGVSSGNNFGIAFSLARTISGSASYSLSWAVGQTIGPYKVPVGHTGEATYGFRAVSMTGMQQTCLPNGTWSSPTPWSAFAPIKNEVRVRLYDTVAGSSVPAQPQSVTANVPTYNGPVTSTPDNPNLDLAVGYTVSAVKAKGYAGSVALRITNTGSQRYFGEYPGVSFIVKVKTASGPQGVDRLITPSSYNGAHIRDLGFDAATSTRSFEVHLSNPIKPGETQLVGSLSFGDGNTSEGRIINYIETSQMGRLNGDNSFDNDQNIDSRQATKTDFGKNNDGLF